MTKDIRSKSETIRTIFYYAERLCDRNRGSHQLLEAVDIAKKQERHHRRMAPQGYSFSSRATVETCATLFALKGFLTRKRDRSYGLRSDFVRAFGAAEECQVQCKHMGRNDYAKFVRKYRKVIDGISYTDLI